jgi:hypothetical protein
MPPKQPIHQEQERVLVAAGSRLSLSPVPPLPVTQTVSNAKSVFEKDHFWFFAKRRSIKWVMAA